MKTLHALVFAATMVASSISAFATAPVVEELFYLPDGEGSFSSLTLAADGYLYGTAVVTTNDGQGGYGIVFRYRVSDSHFETVAKFCTATGYNPGSLVLAPDGNLYGTTNYGGSHGCGSVFRIDPALAQPLKVTQGTQTIDASSGFPEPGIYHYNIYGPMAPGALTVITQTPVSVGYGPSALTVGPDGNLYGSMATSLNPSNDFYHGSLFKVTIAGVMTKLAGFPASYDSFPGGVLFGQDGSLYGTTYNGVLEVGHFFRLSAAGEIINIAEVDAAAGIALGNDGNFYGVTDVNDPYQQLKDYGTAYRLTPDGQHTVLFSSTRATGFNPGGGLIRGPDGNFYGVNENGGFNACGTVFRLTPDGTYTVLAEFPVRHDPDTTLYGPAGGLCFGADGNLYGTAMGGQDYHGGIFRVAIEGAVAVQLSLLPKPVNHTPVARPKPVGDQDHDGIPDNLDAYPGTPRGEPVNKRGASISQLVPPTHPWKNRGQYVNAVTQAANTFRKQKIITPAQSSQIIRKALTEKIKLSSH